MLYNIFSKFLYIEGRSALLYQAITNSHGGGRRTLVQGPLVTNKQCFATIPAVLVITMQWCGLHDVTVSPGLVPFQRCSYPWCSLETVSRRLLFARYIFCRQELVTSRCQTCLHLSARNLYTFIKIKPRILFNLRRLLTEINNKIITIWLDNFPCKI